jgi:hypothetical protein
MRGSFYKDLLRVNFAVLLEHFSCSDFIDEVDVGGDRTLRLKN